MEIVKRISVDFNQKGSAPVVDVVQGDNARFLELELMQNDVPWVLPSFASVLVRYVKPDSTGGIYDTLPDGACAWSIHENVIKIALTEQLCAVSGAVMMQIVVMQGEKQVSTFPIVLRVCNEIAGLEDSQDYRNLATWLEEYGQGGYAHVGDQENPHGVTAQQVGAYAIGDNTVGLLGYYYCAVDFANKTVTLSTEQGKAVVPEEIAWAVGDVVSIVNGGKYEQCAAIVGINGHVLTLDNIPFDKLDPTIKDFDDRSIYVSAKPKAGIVDLGKGAIAMGVHNKSLNRGAVALGEDNEVTAQYGTAIGRLNKVHGYAGFANGRENIVHPGAKYARASGLKNEVWGEESIAEGHECKAYAKGAKATGYKTVANGEFSETAGHQSETIAEAKYAYAGGHESRAEAAFSHVTGLRNISRVQGQLVGGRYNEPKNNEVFTIGCGTSKDDRKNALSVRMDGTTDVYGHKITNVADGTAAGDAVNKRQLDTKAPAGYGLGDYASIQQITTFSSFCKTTEPGWYSVNFTDGTNLGGYSTFALRIDRGVNGAIHHLYAWDATNTKYHELIVGIENGNHVLTEWVNPPMIAGVEYRTTERYNNSPVYAMAFNGASLPATGVAQVLTISSGNIIDLQLVAVQGTNRFQFPLVWGDDGMIAARAFTQLSSNGATVVHVHAFRNVSDYTVEGVVKYTK